MNVFTSTELSSKTKTVCEAVRSQGCVFITNNGKVESMMVDLSAFESINEAVHSYDQWLMQRQLTTLWQHTANSGITLDDIDAEIAAVRSERRKGKASA